MHKVDLKNKTLIINKKEKIKNGIPLDDYTIDPTPITIERLESLFNAYKHSIPSKRSTKRTYFLALPEEELSTTDLITGEDRETAQFNLENAILTGVLNGSLKWNEITEESHFFWASKNDPDFVLLKEWF